MADRLLPFPLSGDASTDQNFRATEQSQRGNIIKGRQSIVTGIVSAGQGSLASTGNSCFACEHGLGATPDYTQFYVRSVELSTGQMGSEDSMETSSVIVEACAAPASSGVGANPWGVADALYSYFTVGLAFLPRYGNLDLDVTGAGTVTFPARCGVPRFATANHTTTLSSSVDVGWDISGQVVSFIGASMATIHFQVWFGLNPGTKIEIVCRSVIGEVWDRNVTAATKVQMHPVK